MYHFPHMRRTIGGTIHDSKIRMAIFRMKKVSKQRFVLDIKHSILNMKGLKHKFKRLYAQASLIHRIANVPPITPMHSFHTFVISKEISHTILNIMNNSLRDFDTSQRVKRKRSEHSINKSNFTNSRKKFSFLIIDSVSDIIHQLRKIYAFSHTFKKGNTHILNRKVNRRDL